MARCEFHSLSYEQPKCPKCDFETWRDRKRAGCMIVFFTWPFALIGVLAGVIFGAFWSAFKDAQLGWDDAWKWIRKTKPK